MGAPIGREQEFGELLATARDAVAGSGSIVFLAGATGSGKSFLVKALVEALAASDADPRPEIVSVRCYETSAGNPLGPFGEVLRAHEHHYMAHVRESIAAAIADDLGVSADDLEPRMAAAATLTVFDLLGEDYDTGDVTEALAVVDRALLFIGGGISALRA